jgi:hypothetical protein
VQNIRRRLSPDLPKNLEQAEQVGVELSTVNRYLQAAKCRSCSTAFSKPAPGRQNRDPHAQFQPPQHRQMAPAICRR